ncbi:MAG: hypothetical protein H7Y04_08145 [Verrucomicrobia bacterium]|nr:hypothetical protein [Cytophagales bacterium]
MRIESEESAYREANRLGVFSRLDYKRFSLQAEIGFSQLTGGSGPLLSADNSLDTSRLGKWSIGRSTELEGTWELGLQGGLRVFKWFRVFAGANVWHTRKSKIIPEIFEENNPLDDDFRRAQAYHQNSRSMVSIAERESILPFVLTRQVGAGLDFKHFSVEAMHELSITPLSRTFNYRGETYPFRRSTSRLTVSLAYRFYRFTFRKKPQIYN